MNTKEQAAAISKVVGANLRQMRIARGWSQQKLGDALEITFQQIQKYEDGKNRLSTPSMCLICKLFGVKPEEFLKGCDYGGEPEAPLDAYIVPKSEVVYIGNFTGMGMYAIRTSAMMEA